MLTACSSQMLNTERLEVAELAKVKTDGGVIARPAHSVAGIPYFLPRTVLPIVVTGKFAEIRKLKDGEKDEGQNQEFVIEIEVKSPEAVADQTAVYMLTPNFEGASDDEFQIDVNEKRLLSGVDLKSEDHSDDIAKKAAETVGQVIATVAQTAIAQNQPKAPVDQDERRKACRKALQEFSITDKIDLSTPLLGLPEAAVDQQVNLDDLNRQVLQDMVRGSGAASPVQGETGNLVSLHYSSIVLGGLAAKPPTPEKDGTISAFKERNGLLFRMPLPLLITTSLSGTTLWTVFDDGTGERSCFVQTKAVSQRNTSITVQDPRYIYELDTSRAIMVKKELKLTVVDGELRSMVVKKPSEALAFIELPIEIIKSLLSPIASLFRTEVKGPLAPSGTVSK